MKQYRNSFIVADADGVRHRLELAGRFAWTLEHLIDAGTTGVTALEMANWALRLGHYVWVLRHRHGLLISTEIEVHGGAFPGKHGKYVLHSVVRRAEERQAA